MSNEAFEPIVFIFPNIPYFILTGFKSMRISFL